MLTDVVSPASNERVATRRLLWVGPLAVIASVAANVLLTMAAVRLFGLSSEFPPLAAGAIAMFTAVGVVGAVVVFALVARFSSRPITLFRRIALAVLLLSLLPDVAMLFSGEPGATPAAVVWLMMTHVVAAAISVALLTTLTREPSG